MTDFIQFIFAMAGSIWATIYILSLPEIDGLANLISHENVVSKLSLLPVYVGNLFSFLLIGSTVIL